ncbi:MAG TPA: hypothetical protein VFN61_12505 [Acidimicrobiales bacterium]|nr:hypothetical protein [Acidimicrobiales bacterium]
MRTMLLGGGEVSGYEGPVVFLFGGGTAFGTRATGVVHVAEQAQLVARDEC